MIAKVIFYFVKNKFEKGAEICKQYQKNVADPVRNYLDILKIVLAKYGIRLKDISYKSEPYFGCKCSFTEQTIEIFQGSYQSKEELQDKLMEIIDKKENLYHAKNVEYVVQVLSFDPIQCNISMINPKKNQQQQPVQEYHQIHQLQYNYQNAQTIPLQQQPYSYYLDNQSIQNPIQFQQMYSYQPILQQQQLLQIHQQQQKFQQSQEQQECLRQQNQQISPSQSSIPFQQVQQQIPVQNLNKQTNQALKPEIPVKKQYEQKINDQEDDDTTPYNESFIFTIDNSDDQRIEQTNKEMENMEKRVINLEKENKQLKKKCEKIDQIEQENDQLKYEQIGLKKKIEELQNQLLEINKLLKKNNILEKK